MWTVWGLNEFKFVFLFIRICLEFDDTKQVANGNVHYKSHYVNGRGYEGL